MAILTLCAFWWKLGSQRCRKNAGATPLYIAAANGHLDTSRFLVESGAAKDRAAHDGATPSMAILTFPIVRFLVEAGAAKDQAVHDGTTPLCIGVARGHRDIVGFFSGSCASGCCGLGMAARPS